MGQHKLTNFLGLFGGSYELPRNPSLVVDPNAFFTSMSSLETVVIEYFDAKQFYFNFLQGFNNMSTF